MLSKMKTGKSSLELQEHLTRGSYKSILSGNIRLDSGLRWIRWRKRDVDYSFEMFSCKRSSEMGGSWRMMQRVREGLLRRKKIQHVCILEDRPTVPGVCNGKNKVFEKAGQDETQ